MCDFSLHDDVRARETDALTLQLELREDEMRRRRADVDPDRPQVQPLGRDVAGQVIRIVIVMTLMVAVVRMRGGQ
jgi:hypothetical protein